jgi:hypothetical protein
MSDIENWEPVTFRKWIVPCLIIAFVLAIPSWYWREYEYEHSNTNYYRSDNGTPLSFGPPKSNQSSNKKEDSNFDSIPEPWWDRPWLIAVITAVYAIFAGLQWKAINLTAKINQEAAKAALLNAEALINSERPWLVVTWASDKKTPGLFLFGCRNHGNTPAKVAYLSARACFVNSKHKLAIPPDYSTHARLPDLNIIVHRGSFEIEHGLNAQTYIRDHRKEDAINSSGEFLVYYGNVIYRDTLYPDSSPEGEHETRWCFFYQPDERKLLREGPKEYNRYT